MTSSIIPKFDILHYAVVIDFLETPNIESCKSETYYFEL